MSAIKTVAIIGISGKLGQYMTQHCLDKGYNVVGVCRPESVKKLDRFGDKIKVFPGRTNDRAVVQQAVKGICCVDVCFQNCRRFLFFFFILTSILFLVLLFVRQF
jgi:nucleoside-diphosphate-sugar epimerase